MNVSFLSRRRQLMLGLATLGGFGVIGCKERSSPAAPIQAQPIEIKSSLGLESEKTARASEASGPGISNVFGLIKSKMHGFQSGNAKSATGIIVVFDPQCPHCGKVWMESQRLNQEVHFAWVPVPLMNRNSTSQGAMLLGSGDPVFLMNEHESSLLSGKGGIALDKDLSEKGKKKIEDNRVLAVELKIDVVPLIFHQKPSGEILMTKGGMRAEELVVLVQS